MRYIITTITLGLLLGLLSLPFGQMILQMEKKPISYSRIADIPISPGLSPLPIPQASPTASASAKPRSNDSRVLATVFWVGETASDENGQIANHASAWDGNWQEHFGGVDKPDERCGFHPCTFRPKENPFYVALPYNDLDSRGQRKKSAWDIPWFEQYREHRSVLKNRWVKIHFQGQTCYGQWQDVGPFEDDDFDYVFGSASPRNQFQSRAGIDVSPAVRDCLGMKTNEWVAWSFVADRLVPNGPWKEIVTTSPVRW